MAVKYFCILSMQTNKHRLGPRTGTLNVNVCSVSKSACRRTKYPVVFISGGALYMMCVSSRVGVLTQQSLMEEVLLGFGLP